MHCDSCQVRLIIRDSPKQPNHHFLCKKCISSTKVCSKTNALRLFLLTGTDLSPLKTIYLNNNHSFYKYDDIKEIVVKKYGSFSNLETIRKEKLQEKRKRDNKKNEQKAIREKKIKEVFELNKLEFKNFGDCYSYINYNKPDLETVINSELAKITIKNSRRITLAKKLQDHNICLDETVKPCYEFVHSISPRSLEETIRAVTKHYKNQSIEPTQYI